MDAAARLNELDLAQATDAALVALCRQGNEGAVRALIRRNNRRLYRTALGVLHDEAEAEDVVQETYVRAFSNLDDFRGEAAISTWLTRIAVNDALQRLRRRRPSAPLESLDAATTAEGTNVIMLPTAAGEQTSPEAATARAQVRAMLERAVAALPDAYRAVFMLRDVEQLNLAETAALLDVKPETVKTRLHRARALVRSSLQGQLGIGFADLFPFDGVRCERIADRVVLRLRANHHA